eukprot:1156876-Pelagomonas_calceolata.AAC.6
MAGHGFGGGEGGQADACPSLYLLCSVFRFHNGERCNLAASNLSVHNTGAHVDCQGGLEGTSTRRMETMVCFAALCCDTGLCCAFP